MRPLRLTLVSGVVLALLTACGGEAGPRTALEPSTAPVAAEGLRLPPAVDPDDWSSSNGPVFHVLTDAGEQLDLPAWTFCGPGICADGAPSENPPRIGSPASLVFGFDRPGWAFEDITFREHGTRSGCGREIRVEAVPTGDRTFRIQPTGMAGDWDVDIFGRGPEGDAVTTVRWQTPREGSFPESAGGLAAVLAEHDGELDSYGVELSLHDLDRHYADASASMTVAAPGGRSVTLPLRSSGRCYSEGDLFFRAPDEVGREAATLGKGPFTYTTRVSLGGETYTGTATWPDDEIEDYAPNVELTWAPPLPVFTG